MQVDPTKVRIVLTEDSAMMRKMEKKILQDLGFENILEAANGDEAIAQLEKEGADLVISDWNMPDKDGFELLVWIRGSEKHKDTPFIMATGQGDKGQEQKAVDAGVSSFVGKPFNADELAGKIDEAFGMQKAEEAVPDRAAIMRQAASGKASLKVAHIQITDHLALGVLKHQIDGGDVKPEHFELETRCMPGWNPVQEALEKGTVDAACILAPIAMDLFRYGTPIKLVLLAHKSGSIAVRRHEEGVAVTPDFFRGKSFLIPHKMSVHHMLAHLFFTNLGLKAGMAGDDLDLNFEVVPPIEMNEFLRTNPDSCGFMVAEPIGTKGISAGVAALQFLSSQLWENHPCCVVVVRDDFIEAFPDAVQELTRLLVQAGRYIEEKPDTAAEIAVEFLDPGRTLGLKVPVLKNVLTEEQGIRTRDLYPNIEDLDRMQRYMASNMGVASSIDLNEFVDTRFADIACKDSPRTESVFRSTKEVALGLMQPKESQVDKAAKTMLELEGKYLSFTLADQGYVIDIVKIREIIELLPITPVPSALPCIKGIFNIRGNVIPAMDLRLMLGMEEAEYSSRTCIIVLDFASGDRQFQMGMIVDAVEEVQDVVAENIEGKPSFGVSVDTDYLLGMVRKGENIEILLDVERILTEYSDHSQGQSLALRA
jgi:chemotaxis signal transduction protein/ABC-type nitrate/sulfonate/bicarbonate transport system substrate-binding protein